MHLDINWITAYCTVYQTLRIKVAAGLENTFSWPCGPQSCLRSFTWCHNGNVGVNAFFFRNNFEYGHVSEKVLNGDRVWKENKLNSCVTPSLCSCRGAWATGMPKQSIVNIKAAHGISCISQRCFNYSVRDCGWLKRVLMQWSIYFIKTIYQEKKTGEGWKGLFLIVQWSNRLLVYMTNGNNSLIRWGLCMLDICPKTVSSRNATKQCKRVVETSVYLRNIFWGQLI